MGALKGAMDYLKEPVTPMEPLKYPVFFVCKELERFQDLIDTGEIITKPEEAFKRCASGPDIWTIQSYVHLRRRGLDVYLTDRFLSDSICLAPYPYLTVKDVPYQSFVVATRTDTARPAICEMQSVMNHLAIQSNNDYFLTHWPQPLIIPRNVERGARVENIDFKGHPRNIISPFRASSFQQALNESGMKFLFDETEFRQHESDGTQFHFWADYSKSDVLIAVRNLTEYDFGLKPALKLINAWRAGVPAILGPEPAYQALRQSSLDYIEASTAEETIAALKKLKNEPKLYSEMVENGYERAKKFTTDCVAMEWHRFLGQQVILKYEGWIRQSLFEKKVVRPLRFAMRCMHHKKLLRFHRSNLVNGTRPVRG